MHFNYTYIYQSIDSLDHSPLAVSQVNHLVEFVLWCIQYIVFLAGLLEKKHLTTAVHLIIT